MKKWFRTWWFKKMIYPGLMKNKAESTVALRDAIVFQMHFGGVGMTHINKWLRFTGQETIKGYMSLPDKRIQLFYTTPSPLRREELGGRYIVVAQF